MAFTCPVLLGNTKPLYALGENTLEEEGAAAFVGRARPSAVSRGLLVSLLGWASTSATSLFMSPLHF